MEQTLVAETQEEFSLGYGACALASCMWGTGFFFGKIALAEMGVAHMVFYRFLFACVVLAPLALRNPAHLSGAEWRVLLLASFFGVPVQFLVQFYGLSLTTVSHAALMVGTMPVLLAVAASLFAHERLDAVGWVALFSSTAGVSLIVLGGTPASSGLRGPSIMGDLLVVFSLAISLGWILLNQRLMRRHPPVVVTTYGLLSGAAMLAVVVLAARGLPPGAGCQRYPMHRINHAAVELGNETRPGVARRSVPEPGTGGGLDSRRAVVGRSPGPLGVAGRRTDCGCRLDPDNSLPNGGCRYSGVAPDLPWWAITVRA